MRPILVALLLTACGTKAPPGDVIPAPVAAPEDPAAAPMEAPGRMMDPALLTRDWLYEALNRTPPTDADALQKDREAVRRAIDAGVEREALGQRVLVASQKAPPGTALAALVDAALAP